MTVDAKKIVASLNKSKTRDTVALYLDTDILERFKKACKALNVKHGPALERLMEEFTASVQADAPKKGGK